MEKAEQLRAAGRQAPGDAEVQYELGNARYDRGQYEEAIVLFEHALEEAPRSDETKPFDRAWLVRAKYELAFCSFRLAEQGDAALYAKTENILQVIDLQAKGLTIREEIIDLWGHLLVKQGRYAEASLKFEELIESFPQSRLVENAWYMLGGLYFKMDCPEKGRKAFEQLVFNFPNPAYAIGNDSNADQDTDKGGDENVLLYDYNR